MLRAFLLIDSMQRALRLAFRATLIFAFLMVLVAFPASAQTAFKPLSSVWCSNAGTVFTAGMEGAIYRFDGANWSKMATPTTQELRDIWGTSPSNVWAVGAYGTIIHYNGSSWSTVSSGTAYGLNSIWGSSANDIYAVGDHGTVLHYDGTSWAQLSDFPAISNQLNEVWGTASNQLWIWSSADSSEGDPIYYFHDGNSWAQLSLPDNSYGDMWINAIWLNPTGHMFAAGTDAKVMRNDYVQWNDIMDSAGLATLNALWGTADDNLYAVGHSGQVLRFDGTSWSNKADGTWSISYVDIDGTSASDIFVVGYDYPTQTGRVLRYNGTSWTSFTQAAEGGTVNPPRPDEPDEPGEPDESLVDMPFVLTLASLSNVRDIEIHGQYAYLATVTNNVQAMDISNPVQPELIGGHSSIYGARTLDMGAGDWLYAGGPYGVARYRMVLPDYFPAPQLSDDMVTAFAVHAVDDYVFYRTGTDFRVMNVSAVEGNMLPGAKINLGGQANSLLAMTGSVAYVVVDNVSGTDNLVAINVANPASPVSLGNVGELTNARAMLVVGGRLYVAENDSTLAIFDLSNPSAPSLIRRIDLTGEDIGTITALASLGGNRLLLGARQAMCAVDASYPNNPRVLARTSHTLSSPLPVSLAVVGSVAYCGFFEESLQVLDVSNVVAGTGDDSDSGGGTPDGSTPDAGNENGGSGGGCAMAPGSGLGLEWLLLGLAVILTRLRCNCNNPRPH